MESRIWKYIYVRVRYDDALFVVMIMTTIYTYIYIYAGDGDDDIQFLCYKRLFYITMVFVWL